MQAAERVPGRRPSAVAQDARLVPGCRRGFRPERPPNRRETRQVETGVDPWWAALTAWGVVNAVNVLQAAGFLSRVYTGSRAINRLLG